MKRLPIWLSAFFLTFALGSFLDKALSAREFVCANMLPDGRVEWEEEIAENVLRYQIEHFTPVDSAVYYLSVGGDTDPSNFIMESLRRIELPVRRLSELGMYPIRSYGCYYCAEETEFILRVGNIYWLSDDRVLVGGSLRRWRGNTDQAFLFHVMREDGEWIVKGYEVL